MSKESLFELSHNINSKQLLSFSNELKNVILSDGEINKEQLIKVFNEHLKNFDFSLTNSDFSTDYLVIKLSKDPSHTYQITPLNNLEFDLKVKFIERVFSQIRNTELLFDNKHRIITFCYDRNNKKIKEIIKKNYKNKLVAFSIKNNPTISKLTDELLLFAKANENENTIAGFKTVEIQFCTETSRSRNIIKKIKWDSDNPIQDEELIKELKKNKYGFDLDLTKLILLIKWMVFPNVVVLFYPTPGSEESGQGGIVWGIKFKNPPTLDLLWCIESYSALLCSFIDKILQTQHQLKAKQSTIKSAVAAVMSRNMSHNIGSHVLAKLSTKQSLESLEVASEKLNSIAKLNEYLKLRMDFLADIATTVPTFEVQKDLKNDVLKWFSTEGKENQYELILKHITGNEKKAKISLPEAGYFVSFPNDLLGVQAFYIILENIIRNTAKHSKSSTSSFEINFEINENANPELISVTIFDDCESLNRNPNLVGEQNNRIKEPLLKNGILRHNAWGTLEMKIAAAYLRKVPTSDIDLPKYNPIAFQSSEQNEIETQNNIPPLIEAVNHKQNLAYRIYLLKPKELLIFDNSVYDNPFGLDTQKIEQLRNWGIWYYNKNNFSFDKTYNQKFVLLINPNEDIINKIISNCKNFPFRRFILNNNNSTNDFINYSDIDFINKLKDLSQKQEVDNFILTFWNLWTSHLSSKQNIFSLEFQNWGKDHNGTSILNFSKELLPNNANDKKVAVFHHHPCQNFDNDFSSIFYFEQYGSSGLLAPLVDKVEENSLLIKRQFLESIITSVAIIDERIQELSNQLFNDVGGFNNNSHPTYLEIFEKAKIEILPEETADLNASEYTDEIKNNVSNWLKEKVGSLHFLVIHLGVLERICRTSDFMDEEKRKKVKSYLDNIQALNKDLKIIVISGRGKPDTLPEDTLFIHYSLISQYLFENRSKFHFTQLLYSSRKQI